MMIRFIVWDLLENFKERLRKELRRGENRISCVVGLVFFFHRVHYTEWSPVKEQYTGILVSYLELF